MFINNNNEVLALILFFGATAALQGGGVGRLGSGGRRLGGTCPENYPYPYDGNCERGAYCCETDQITSHGSCSDPTMNDVCLADGSYGFTPCDDPPCSPYQPEPPCCAQYNDDCGTCVNGALTSCFNNCFWFPDSANKCQQDPSGGASCPAPGPGPTSSRRRRAPSPDDDVWNPKRTNDDDWTGEGNDTGMYLLFGFGIFFIAGCFKAGGPKGCYDCWSDCCECFSGMLHDMCCKKEDKTKKTSGSNAYNPPQP